MFVLVRKATLGLEDQAFWCADLAFVLVDADSVRKTGETKQ